MNGVIVSQRLLRAVVWIESLLMLCMMGTGCTPERNDPQHQLVKHYHLQTPEGNGPFPAIMLIPGCGGFRSSPNQQAHYSRMARQLNHLGYVTVYVDYLAARELTYCHPLVGLPDVARDVLSTATYLQSRPEVRAEAIIAMGWSYGGGGALAALSTISTASPSPIRAVVAFYPVCVGVRPWQVNVPILMQIGSHDQQTPPDICRQLDTPLTTISVYAKARHGFDVAPLPPNRADVDRPGRQNAYDQQVAAMAWQAIEQFLQRHTP